MIPPSGPAQEHGQDPFEQHAEAIGPFRILEQLGEGGMGTVYLAEQREPVRRRVALKLIKLGMDSREVVGRFHAERQALACMNHPNIAKVLDAGTTSRGRPYFAMEYVPGVPITEYCRKERLNVRERIELFRAVCRGIQHAHQKGVVHRDIKPGNILVQLLDTAPVPKVIDFGVAKALDNRLVEETYYTEHGRLIGTPEYMSPEQAELTGLDVDTRTDIYSLGVLLYELLTDKLPFDRKELRAGGYVEIQRRIREVEPPRPSTRFKTSPDSALVAQAFATDVGGLTRALRGDLDWIVMRCLEKSPARRYASASELEADLERHLQNEPVLAGPPRVGYRLGKLLRRRRGAVTASAAVLVTLVTGTVVATRQATRAERAADLERAQRQRAESAEALAHDVSVRLRERTIEFERLEGVVLLQRARAQIRELDPPWPERLPAIEAWLAGDAARLVALGPVLEAALDGLQQRALPWSATERLQDRRTHPELLALERARQELATLERAARVHAGVETVVRPSLPAALAASKAGVLVHVAFMRIASPERVERTLFGDEAFGLAAAECALARVLAGDPSVPLSSIYPIVVHALCTNGLDHEAERRAVEYAAMLAGEERAAAQQNLAKLIAAHGHRGREPRRAHLSSRIAALEQQVSTRRTWTFGAESDQYLHDTLQELRQSIEVFERDDVAAVALRRKWALGLKALERQPAHLERWQAARSALAAADGAAASRLYAAHPITLGMQHGLAPIGKNPASGLWEFYDLRSAWDPSTQSGPLDIPIPHASDYGPDGGLGSDDRWPGMVFVLIPGGTFTIGAQDADPAWPRYDPDGSRTEGWPQPVTLAPFFLAKHEVTQQQWQRLSGGEMPSEHKVGYGHQGTEHRVTPHHPVELVSWAMAHGLAEQVGAGLPTEAQWEYTCRAGTDSPYSTGEGAESLVGHANVHDATAARLTGAESDVTFEDGYRITAPVASFAPNAWGLFDMHGNVWEWCHDGAMGRAYSGIWREGDGLTPEDGRQGRVIRGGSYAEAGHEARSARRSSQPADSREADVGVRFARTLRAELE